MTSVREKLVGVWRLVAYEARRQDGSIVYPAGPDALGLLVLAADGYISAQIMPAHRPAFAGGDMLRGTPEEVQAAFRACISYFGTYTVDETQGCFVTRVISSLFPNWIGSYQVRFYEFAGDRLTLRTQPIPLDETTRTVRLVWERAAAAG